MAKTNESKEFAIIEAAGKQYRVSVGDVITLDKQMDSFKEGEKTSFDKVLLINDGNDPKIGAPYISGASVQGIFVQEGRSKKLLVWRFRAKSRYSRKYGHRQPFTKIKIAAIA